MGSNNGGGGGMIMIVIMAVCACCVLACMGSSAAVALTESLREKLGIATWWNDTFGGGGGGGDLPLDEDGDVASNELPADETSTASDCEQRGTCPNNTGKGWLCRDPWSNDQWYLKFDKDGLNPRCFKSGDASYEALEDDVAKPIAYNFRDLNITKRINAHLNTIAKDGGPNGITSWFYDETCPVTINGEANQPAITFALHERLWEKFGRKGCIPKDKKHHSGTKHIWFASPVCVNKETGEKNPKGTHIARELDKNWENTNGNKNCFWIDTTNPEEKKRGEWKGFDEYKVEWHDKPAWSVYDIGNNKWGPN